MVRSAHQVRFCTSKDGVRIAYAVGGSGPPLVRAPYQVSHLKLDQDSLVWRHWLSLFTYGRTLVRYDLRGCGLSDMEGVEFSFEKYIEDLESVVDAAGVRRFALFGIAGGGATAIGYAARHPERVSHLVLLGCYVLAHNSRVRLSPDPTPRQIEEVELHLKSSSMAFAQDNPAMRQLYTTIRMPDGSPDQQRAFNDLMRAVTNSENATALLRPYLDVDLREVAPKVRCPTLIFHARGDGVAPFEEGRSLAALIPDARFVPLESRNQLLTADEPAWQQLVDELNEFLPAGSALPDSATDQSLEDLTRREREVLELVAQGLDNTTIGDRLGISERTVRNNVSIIFNKLGVHTRAQAIVQAREAGLGRG